MHVEFFYFCCLQEYNLVYNSKNNTNKIQNKVSCEGVEPQFFEEHSAIVTHFLGPTTPRTTHFSPTQLITINLQMIIILDSFVKSFFSPKKYSTFM